MTLAGFGAVLAALAFLLGIFNTAYALRRDRRMVSVRVVWKWVQGKADSTGVMVDRKWLTVFVVNQQPRPLSIRFVVVETKVGTELYRQAIWQEGHNDHTGSLAEGQYLWADFNMADWEQASRVFAVDAHDDEWDATPENIASIRDGYRKTGTVKEYGMQKRKVGDDE